MKISSVPPTLTHNLKKHSKMLNKTIVWLFILIANMLWVNVVVSENRQTLPVLKQPLAAPDFELQGEDGKTYKLSDYRGKVVVMNFWASWCPPCRYEMPSLERLWQKVKDKGVVVLGINVGESADAIFEFTGSYAMSFPIPMDIEGKVIKKYSVAGLPATYIISPDGLITHRAVGSREWDDKSVVEMLLKMQKK